MPLVYTQERLSAFQHTLWDRYGLQSALTMSGQLAELDGQGLQNLGYSTVQDAYYCLSGRTPKPDTALEQFWREAAAQADFPKLAQLFGESDAGKIVATQQLAAQAMRFLEPDTAQQQEARAAADAGVDPQDPAYVPDGQGDPACLVTGRPSFHFSADAATERARGIESLVSFCTAGTPAEKLATAELLLETLDLRALVNMLGWAQSTVAGAARTGRAAAGELTGYRLNGWTDRVRPDQMIAVAQGDLQALAALAEGQLTNREYAQEQPRGKGPVVLLRDESTSMLEEDKLQVSRSFEIALAKAFNKEHRDLISIAWSTNGTRQYTYGESGLLEHLRSFLRGMTRIERALGEAMAAAMEYVTGADILIVTDGQLQTSPTESAEGFVARMTQLLAPFRAYGGRCWLIVLGSESAATLRNTCGWTDGWVRVDQLGTGQEITDMLASVATRAAGNQRQLL